MLKWEPKSDNGVGRSKGALAQRQLSTHDGNGIAQGRNAACHFCYALVGLNIVGNKNYSFLQLFFPNIAKDACRAAFHLTQSMLIFEKKGRMKEYKSCSLKPYNTFGIEAEAIRLIILEKETEVEALSELLNSDEPRLILGGGSNILLTNNFEGNVIAPWYKGIEIVEDKADSVRVKVAAGEEWDSFAEWACQRNYWGIENLSLIPGKVGASPIQNIGAYGVEVKDVIESVNFFEIEKGAFRTLTNQQCQFGYRNSIFKQELKGKIIVTSVTFKLSKEPKPILHYANLQDLAGASPTTMAIRKVVINIRESKLPDPKITGNAGSFFKNPVIDEKLFNELKATYPDIPSYPGEKGTVKIPAGWLIEKGGWKGKTVGNVGVHAKQALVIVNYGGATGEAIIGLAKEVQRTIKNQFGIELEMEVNAI